MIEHHIVRVEWVDAVTPGDVWLTKAGIQPESNFVTSIGYLVNENEDYTTLVGSIGSSVEEPSYGQVIHIPTQCIREMHRLRKL